MALVTIDKPRSPADWAAMREICCETAARPIPPEEREAFGRRWIGPYERWAPRWAYVARADDGRVVGYLTGCASTWRMIALRVLLGPRWRPGANARFPLRLPCTLVRRYPAHLHVNVREGFRGGVGRALVSRYEDDLRRSLVGGVHLFCGERAAGFYRKTGFDELASLPVGERLIYCFGKRLRA